MNDANKTARLLAATQLHMAELQHFQIFLPAHDLGKTTPSAPSLLVSLSCQQHQLSLHNWTHSPRYSPTVTLIQMCMIGLCIPGKQSFTEH